MPVTSDRRFRNLAANPFTAGQLCFLSFAAVFWSAAVSPLSLLHASITPEEREFFEKRVRPVLAENCYQCHGPEKQRADLRVDSREALLKGSDTGPAITPGKPDDSPLIKSIRHEDGMKMPEKGDGLPKHQIEALAEWVKAGAPWPEEEKPHDIKADAKKHWAWQPIGKPPVPAIKGNGTNPVDAFIQEKLAAKGITPSARADRRALVRRAHFVLTGLPPTAEEIETFESDKSPEAWAKVIQRLLDSPHYGERWGRHWLDVARYADTKGYVFQEERRYPFAYTYRDWVVNALNTDLPYNEFLIRQIAADLHVPDSAQDKAALGFLLVGRRFLNNAQDIIDDRIDVVARGTMGLTLACARCHDHKFEPLTQKDYYAMQGVFLSTEEPEELPLLPQANGTPPLGSEKYQAELNAKSKDVEQFLAKAGGIAGIRVALAIGHPVIIPSSFAEHGLDKGGRTKLREFEKKRDAVYARSDAPPRAMVMRDKATPVTPRVLRRGNPGMPGATVPRRFIELLGGSDDKAFKTGSGRLEMAKAIASPQNPLTARVLVNRVWMQHFGEGLVTTPGDFGVKGELPSHPELLDWLSSWFIENGWSLKKLHALIMSSATWQQASTDRPDARALDSENRLWWRQNRRRLDFESARDGMLAVSGQLDGRVGGQPEDLMKPETKRRTIYGLVDRQNLPGLFRTFDFANPDTTAPRRYHTTVPQQALFFLNSDFAFRQARSVVADEDFKTATPSAQQIDELFRQVLGRSAGPNELQAMLEYLTAAAKEPESATARPGWSNGVGFYNRETTRVEFTAMKQFVKDVWQQGAKLPDAVYRYASLRAQSGHPGPKGMGVIRRWTAADDGVFHVTGAIKRPDANGDGVEARIVSSTRGLLWETVVEPGKTSTPKVEPIAMKAGEYLDFVVECRENETSDTFNWAPTIRSATSKEAWSSETQFAGPAPTPPTSWEQVAQALLASNEFMFVD